MFTPLTELYRDPAIVEHAHGYTDMWRKGRVEGNLERAGVLGSLTTEAALMEHVESLPEDDPNESRLRAARLLGCLPPSVLLYNFGEEVMAWTVANDEYRRSRQMREALEEEGYDSRFLMKARMLAWQEHKPPRGRDVLKQNAVMEAVMSGALDKISLPPLLQQATLPGASLNANRLKDYGLIPLQADPDDGSRLGGEVYEWEGREAIQEPGLAYRIWLDTPAGFALTFKGVPQAVVGVVANETSELQIRQIQKCVGKRYGPVAEKAETPIKHPRGFRQPLDWQKLMVGITEELANVLGKDTLGIQDGTAIAVWRDNHENTAEVADVYDSLAERLGFSADQDGNWHRPIIQK